MKELIGYKVITKCYRLSCTGSNLYSSRHYYKNIETRPRRNCGPLCVFDTYSAAFTFITDNKNIIIVKCKYKRSTSNKIWDEAGHQWHLIHLPQGTILASSVTCLE